MKNGINNTAKGDNIFGVVLLAIILLIIFACLFGWFCWKSRKTEGFLDERYFLYLEDMDFCLRAKKKGYKIIFEPKAIIWHKNFL